MGILYNLKLLQPREPLASHHPDQSATTNIQGNHVLKCGRSLQRFYFIREVIDLQHATQTPIAGVQRAHGPRDPFQVAVVVAVSGDKRVVLLHGTLIVIGDHRKMSGQQVLLNFHVNHMSLPPEVNLIGEVALSLHSTHPVGHLPGDHDFRGSEAPSWEGTGAAAWGQE
ncbi:uncharacterized protein [Canis lupus baileyi]|uniref:uncharacterized protein isoform X2 n=1 Tax=Canis lupus baileyi TaxID=143281 RepID=UPI003B97B9DF